jgi:hypothetical protein
MTPFLYYACEQRKILKQEGVKLTLPEQSRQIALTWKTVTDKSKYIEQAQADRDRYTEQMKSYVPPVKVKRPRSSYAFFMKDIRAQIAAASPDKNPRELMTDIAKAWKGISTEERKRYQQMAVDDRERYNREKKD